ncbi:hypothetical protein P4O66_015895 [Electrophorus voltai]|uniref:Uncharacterized protein n=1 Tax=Electrophorus voltai TaxID=2609070 RepID=A0AAD8YZY4_9TELE|nr:hypothetical protein P4O66_015895 [Electrophorus voltai]
MEAFSSKDMAMKVQKKFLSHIASKSMAQMFIDDNSSEVLDELYRVSKAHSGNQAEAKKVVKNMIKVAVKVGVLIRHDKFSPEELGMVQEFRKKLHTGAMTAISFQEGKRAVADYTIEFRTVAAESGWNPTVLMAAFHQGLSKKLKDELVHHDTRASLDNLIDLVEFTFDKAVMIGLLTECRDLLLQLVEKHLTPKSLSRIRHVFNHYSDPDLLTHLYEPQGTLWPNLTRICSGLNQMIEEGKL